MAWSPGQGDGGREPPRARGVPGVVPPDQHRHLLVLARDPEGYRRLCAVISAAQLAGGEKGRPVYDLARWPARTTATGSC